jgi:hypothetical protein
MPPKRARAALVKPEVETSPSDSDSSSEDSSLAEAVATEAAREFSVNQHVDAFASMTTMAQLALISGICKRLSAVLVPLKYSASSNTANNLLACTDAMRVLMNALRPLTAAVLELTALERLLQGRFNHLHDISVQLGPASRRRRRR